ncbi:hypothetical protein BKA93DRAFT_256570 [Sparassis latifolia]
MVLRPCMKAWVHLLWFHAMHSSGWRRCGCAHGHGQHIFIDIRALPTSRPPNDHRSTFAYQDVCTNRWKKSTTKKQLIQLIQDNILHAETDVVSDKTIIYDVPYRKPTNDATRRKA